MSSNTACLQCGQDPCSQCPETPCIPVAPPPSCNGGTDCDEYILSDCVITNLNESCTVTIETDNGPVTVGLVITPGMTLTEILEQLTSTACIFDPLMLEAWWENFFSDDDLFVEIIQKFFTKICDTPELIQQFITCFFENILTDPDLYQYFTTIICDIKCDGPCAIVDGVEQMVFTDVTDFGFDLNWVAMPGQTYFIRINDSQTVPTTYYEYTTPTAPAPGNVPVAVSIKTSAFIKYENGVAVPNNGLASNVSFEVYITAIKIVNGSPVECETGPFTITTLSDAGCVCTTTINVVDSNTNPAGPGELSVDIVYQAGTPPIGYEVTVTSVTTGLIVNGGPITIPPSPGLVTNYLILLPDDDYDVFVRPVCSIVPFCTGTPDNVIITVDPAAFCAPPDITLVSIN